MWIEQGCWQSVCKAITDFWGLSGSELNVKSSEEKIVGDRLIFDLATFDATLNHLHLHLVPALGTQVGIESSLLLDAVVLFLCFHRKQLGSINWNNCHMTVVVCCLQTF